MESTGDLRVSDADREAVAAQLRQHTVDGRLTTGEFTDRLDEVFAAKTRRELDATLRELPPLHPPAPARRPAAPPALPRVPGPLAPLAVVGAVLLGLWALTGFGYFWPIWPLMFWILPVMLGVCGRHHARHHGGSHMGHDRRGDIRL
jgi:hypothetical protein